MIESARLYRFRIHPNTKPADVETILATVAVLFGPFDPAALPLAEPIRRDASDRYRAALTEANRRTVEYLALRALAESLAAFLAEPIDGPSPAELAAQAHPWHGPACLTCVPSFLPTHHDDDHRTFADADIA